MGRLKVLVDQSIRENDDLEGSRYYGAVALTMPLGCEFGFQIDGVAGHLGEESTWSIGGHLFARDPSTHLIGIYAEHTDIGGNDVNRIAAEGELYLGQFTLSGLAGFEDSDISNNDFFGAGRVSFYATDNLNLHVGFASFLDVEALTLGVEWQPDGSNMSLFASGEVGDDDHSSVLGGVRFYFGGDQKTLIRRHREDDPPLWAPWLKTNDDAMCPAGEIYLPGEGFCFRPKGGEK